MTSKSVNFRLNSAIFITKQSNTFTTGHDHQCSTETAHKVRQKAIASVRCACYYWSTTAAQFDHIQNGRKNSTAAVAKNTTELLAQKAQPQITRPKFSNKFLGSRHDRHLLLSAGARR